MMLWVAFEEGESSERLRRLLVRAGAGEAFCWAGEPGVSTLISLKLDLRREEAGPGERPLVFCAKPAIVMLVKVA